MPRLRGVTLSLLTAVMAGAPVWADDALTGKAYWGSPSVDGGKCCNSLDEVRTNIDRLDRQIIKLMAERGHYVAEAGRFKANPAAVSVPARVEQIILKVKQIGRENGLPEIVAEKAYRAMIAAFEDYEREEWLKRNGEKPRRNRDLAGSAVYIVRMCGRYAITLAPEAMRQLFKYEEQPNFPPRYNIAPTQPVPVVTARDGARHFTLMRWGFIPGWVKEMKDFPLVINVRSETVREKASFKAAFIRRRGLMPADAFYEWHREEGSDGPRKTSTPYMLRRRDGQGFAFAALYETWHSPDGSEIDTAALMNTHANGLIAAIHHRSPVILDAADFDAWLDPASTPDALQRLLKPPADDLLEMVRIGTAINKVANDDASVQIPVLAEARKAPEHRPPPAPPSQQAFEF